MFITVLEIDVIRIYVQTIDGWNIRGPIEEPESGEEEYAWRRDGNDGERYVWPRRTKVEVEQMVQDAFARADFIHEGGGVEHAEVQNLNDLVNLEGQMHDLNVLIGESVEAVYEGCGVNHLQASIVFLNMVNIYGVPYSFLDELLRFLAADLLPQSNCLLRSTYDMKTMLMKMGLEHRAIHCCSSGHILYEGPEKEELLECPHCGESRYVLGSTSIPQKVLRYFPVIPRLQRLF